MFEDVIPLMENDGIALEEEDKHRLVSHGCANEVSLILPMPKGEGILEESTSEPSKALTKRP